MPLHSLHRLFFVTVTIGFGLPFLATGCQSHDAMASPGATRPVEVIVAKVEKREFRDTVVALGTARARESAELTAKLTETVRKLHFDDGDEVRRGQLLVELTRAQEHAQLVEARAELANAQSEARRYDALSEQSLVSGLERDRQRHAARLAEARLSTIQARLADRVILAPFDGVVGLRNVSVGSVVSPDTVVATIDDVSTIKVDFPVPETELDGLRPGLDVAARSGAFPRASFRGQVTGIDTRVDPATRSVIVRAEIPNPERQLRAGMLLTVEVVRATRQAPAVPAAALVALGERSHVFALRDDDTVRRVEVDLGHRGARFVEVAKGLAPGTEVVVEGTLKLRDGAPVAPRRGDGA